MRLREITPRAGTTERKRLGAIELVSVAVLALAIASCDGGFPRIRSVSATTVREGTPATLVVETENCAPGFDLDRGVQTGNSGTLRLGAGRYEFPGTRIGSDSFTVALSGAVAPGPYALDLALDDGRHARFDGDLTVTPAQPVITAVASPRSTISFGEFGIPLSVTVTNPSACAVDGLQIVPRFSQGTTNLSFPVNGGLVHIDPRSAATFDLFVDVGAEAVAGTILINAVGVGGTSNGPGCSGTVDAASQARDEAWFVVTAAHQAITVTNVTTMTHNVRVGELFTVDVTAQNNSTVTLTPERIDIQSAPSGIVVVPGPLSGTLAPGASATYTVTLTATPVVMPQVDYMLSAVMIARDDAGALYASPRSDASVTVTGRGP